MYRFIFFAMMFIKAFSEDRENSPLLSPESKKIFKKEQSTISKEVVKDELKKTIDKTKKAAVEAAGASSDIMIVDPKIVSQDWTEAFNSFNAKKLPNISFMLKDNSTIANVINLEPMPGGYLILFTIKTIHGIKYQIVKTSDIRTLTTK